MISTDTFVTGAAGAAPMPAAVVRPSRLRGVVAMAPTAAPFQGTGLPCSGTTSVVRPWAPSPAGTRDGSHRTDVSGAAAPRAATPSAPPAAPREPCPRGPS